MATQQNSTVDILAIHERAGARQRRARLGSVAAGAVLTTAALLRGRSASRVLLGAAGAFLIARGISGLSVSDVGASLKNLFKSRTDLEKRFHDGEHDIVDAASFDSFPASDPPSYSPGAG